MNKFSKDSVLISDSSGNCFGADRLKIIESSVFMTLSPC